MDVEFVNSYTEVVVENFDAVIKQNLMLQTQLKLAGKKQKIADEQRVKLESVEKDNNDLKNQLLKYESDLTSLHSLEKTVSEIDVYKREIADLRGAIVKYDAELKEAQSYKSKVIESDSLMREKNRIQEALNNTMANIAALENQLKQKDVEIESLKESLKKIEEVPVVEAVKDKKTITKSKNGTSATVETPPKSVKVQSGGFF